MNGTKPNHFAFVILELRLAVELVDDPRHVDLDGTIR